MKVKDNFEDFEKAKSISIALTDMVAERETDITIVEEWLREDDTAINLIKKFSDENNIEKTYNDFGVIEKNRDKLIFEVNRRKKARKQRLIIRSIISSCAAALLMISFTIYYNNQVIPEKNSTQQANNETQSGKSLNPILKLSSGKVYELVADANNATEKDINYIVGKDSIMNLNELQKKIYGDSAAKSEDILYLELSIPDKSSYTVILSDSSEIILNANSSISYPEKFTKDKREVTIKGEAFFNVKKSKTPFIVNIGNSYVKVYGTSFNINARDAKMVKTTLVSGVVGVGAKDIAEQILKPNQMAVVNTDLGKCLISDVDAENSIGWVMGSIICIDNNLESLINDLEAWYGVDIRYDRQKEAIKNIRMNILIKHTMKIDEALKLIEKVTDVKFINEGGYYSIKIN